MTALQDHLGTSETSLVPARIDRLRWSRFHTRLVLALGVAWVLDGLEITIASNSTSIISSKAALHMSSASVSFWPSPCSSPWPSSSVRSGRGCTAS